MHPRFHPRLINGPFEDPGLYIPFLFENRAVIFDLGDALPLTARELLKISHAFITHTHVDHSIGFDRVLRISLGRENKLHLYGPRGTVVILAVLLRDDSLKMWKGNWRPIRGIWLQITRTASG
ncbi:MAG: hypothetical protein P8X80_06340 [Desulfobacterales bacterium]